MRGSPDPVVWNLGALTWGQRARDLFLFLFFSRARPWQKKLLLRTGGH